jgi:hypothetical protein
MSTLYEYRVTLHEEKGDKFTLLFDCCAIDACHAEEQALDMYQLGEVLHIYLKDEGCDDY